MNTADHALDPGVGCRSNPEFDGSPARRHQRRLERVSADLVKNAGLDEVTRRISAQLVNSDVREKISRGWALP